MIERLKRWWSKRAAERAKPFRWAANRTQCVKCAYFPADLPLPSHGCRYDPKKDLLIVKCVRCGHRWTALPSDRVPSKMERDYLAAETVGEKTAAR